MSEERRGRHALLIATSRHDDPQLGLLDGPQADARTLARVLRAPSIGGFNVKTLTNPTSSRAAEVLEEFFADRGYDDVLLLFFSGHGLKHDDGELYLAMRNTRRRKLRSTSLSTAFVREIMRDCASQRQIVILDCCYGGAFAREFAKGDDGVDAIDHLTQGFGSVVLTASNALEFAWLESSKITAQPQRSVFTGIITEGLRSGAADIDEDGAITPQNLYDYACRRVLRAGRAPNADVVLGRPGGATPSCASAWSANRGDRRSTVWIEAAGPISGRRDTEQRSCCPAQSLRDDRDPRDGRGSRSARNALRRR